MATIDTVGVKYTADVSDLQNKLNSVIESNIKLDKSANDASEGIKDTGNEAKDAGKKVDKAAESIDKLGKTVNNTTSLAKRMGDTFKEGIKLIMPLTVAGMIQKGFGMIVDSIKNAIKSQKEWESSLASLKAITGASSEDLKFYREAARRVAQEFGVMGKDVVEAYKLVGSAKPELLANSEALAAVTRQAIFLAKAAGLEVPDAVTRLTQVMNQFNAPAEDAGRYVNILAEASKLGAAEVPALAEGMVNAGSAAKASNVSFAETAAVLEALAEKGQVGAEAGTHLRNVLLRLTNAKSLPKEAIDALEAAGVNIDKLSNTTLPLTERLEELGKVQGNVGAITAAFGEASFTTASIMIEQRGRINELSVALGKDGLTTAYEQAAINMDTLAGSQERLSATWDLLISQEGGISRLFRAIIQGATNSLIKLDNLGLYFRLMVKDLEDLGTQDLNKLLDFGVTDSQKTIASFLAPFEQVSEIDFQKNAQLYKKQFVDALVLEGEEIGDATVLFDQYIRNRTDQMIAGYKANKKVVVTSATELEDIAAQAAIDAENARKAREAEAIQKEEQARVKRMQNEFSLQQMRIELMKDGVGKELAARELAYQREQEQFRGNKEALLLIEQKYLQDINEIATKDIKADMLKSQKEAEEKEAEIKSIIETARRDANIARMTSQEKELFDLEEFYKAKLLLVAGNEEAIALLTDEWEAKKVVVAKTYKGQEITAQQETNDAKLQLAQDLSTASLQIGESLIRDQAKLAEFQKTMALFQIGLDTAIAISGVVRAASSTSLTPIDQAIKVAAGIGIVLVNIAKAKALLTEPPAFKDGVIDLQGPGTETSDSIVARLSRRESVMTAKETKSYKDELTAMRNGNYEDLILSKYVMPILRAERAAQNVASNNHRMIQAAVFDDDRIVSGLRKIKPATAKDIEGLGIRIERTWKDSAFKSSKKWQA